MSWARLMVLAAVAIATMLCFASLSGSSIALGAPTSGDAGGTERSFDLPDASGAPEAAPAMAAASATEIEAAKARACSAHCAAEGTLCLDVEGGGPFCANKGLPPEVFAGARLAILVMGPKGFQKPFDVSTSTIQAIDRLFRDPAAGKQLGAAEFEPLKELDVTTSEDVAVQGIRIHFTGPFGSRDYILPINHGRYFLDLGLLLALAPNGVRTVGAAPIAGTLDQQIVVREDWAVRPALMLNAYVFGGHRRAGVCAFCNLRSGVRGVFDFLGDFVAIQGGIDLDLSHVGERLYFGAVFEPISGLSFDTGVALLKNQFLPAGYRAGMLLDPAFRPEERLVPRFYFGFTLSLEILNSVAKLSRDVRGVQFQ